MGPRSAQTLSEQEALGLPPCSVSENCLASVGVVPQPCNTEKQTEKLRNTTANSGPQWRRWNAQNPTGATGTELPNILIHWGHPHFFSPDMEPRCHILSIYSWKRTRLLADSCLSAVGLYYPHLPKEASPTFQNKWVWLSFTTMNGQQEATEKAEKFSNLKR